MEELTKIFDEQRQEILDQSNAILDKLSGYAIFFENVMLMDIFRQSKIIHQLFVDNEDIDINKLELFHLQFTSTLIDLVEKIKQKNARIVKMFSNEINLNNDIIQKLRKEISKEGGFESEKQIHAVKMAKTLQNIYIKIYEKSDENPFTEDISSFSINYYKDHFFESSIELFNKVTTFERNNVFRNRHVTIDKNLLITLGQAKFAVIFYAGVTAYPMIYEIFKIHAQDVYFIYWPSKNLFIPCNIEEFPYQEWEKEFSKKTDIIKRLIKNNHKLEMDIIKAEKYIPEDIEEILQTDYEAISNIDFLASLEDIDMQAKVLKSMLNTKMI